MVTMRYVGKNINDVFDYYAYRALSFIPLEYCPLFFGNVRRAMVVRRYPICACLSQSLLLQDRELRW